MKLSPLHDWHRSHGARMVEFGGWEMPLEYPAGTIAEHMACRSSVAVFDVSHLGTVRCSGPGAFERLQGILCNDLSRVAPGRSQYTQLLASDGSVLDDIIVWWVTPDRFDIMPNASNTERVLSAVGGEDATASRAVLAVQGPRAREVLAAVFPGAAMVGRSRVAQLEWGDAPAVVAGTGYTGEDGVECAVDPSTAADLVDALVEAGACPAGLGARDTLRLEAGLPLHGHELGPGITPLDAGLGWVVAWDKPGGFQGLEALRHQRASGRLQRLCGVLGEGRRPLRAGYGVELDDRRTSLTSGGFSPVLQRGIGMCFVPSPASGPRPGTCTGELRVEVRGRSVPARLRPLPFVAHSRGLVGGGEAG